MTQKQFQSAFFFSLLVIFGVLAFFIIRIYLVILAVALALAILFRPLFNWFRKRLNFERGMAALFTTLIVFFLVALPLVGLGVVLGVELGDLYHKLQAFIIAERGRGAASSALAWFTTNYGGDIAEKGGVATIYSFLTRNVASVFSGASNVFLAIFLFFISFYYFMKDGHVFREKLFGISPLSDASEAKIYNTVLIAINAVMRGAIIIALVQGTLAGLGFWLFGVGAPILFGTITAFASLLPMIGTSLVTVPAIIYLFIKGSYAAAIGLTIWSGVVVGLVDNMLKPKLIEQRMKIHPLFILLSILGGIEIFGFFGFIVGPLVLAIGWALLEIYREEFHANFSSSFDLDD